MKKNLIRKEIKEDNTFGGNFPYSINYQNLPTHYIDISPEQRDIIDADISRYVYDSTQDGIFDSPKGVVDIINSQSYQQKLLIEAKKKKISLNQKTLDEKETLTTSFGVVNLNTPIGRVDVMATGFLNLVSITKTNLPAGTFRTYTDGVEAPSPEMTPEQVGEFYLEIFNGLNNCDKRYKQIESSINNAQSLDELEAVEINYTDI